MRRARKFDPYYMPPAQVISDDRAANLAFFLLETTGSVCGRWHGRMTAPDQRTLMGRYLGKGHIVIDGATERVRMTVAVCFGTDWDVRENLSWGDLNQ